MSPVGLRIVNIMYERSWTAVSFYGRGGPTYGPTR
jgi:hypothetical protein